MNMRIESYMTFNLVHVLAVLFALQVNVVRAVDYKDLWTISIDESPAPPPDQGPPLSAHASRNKALLPYQITGIIGAYLIFASTVLILLLFVGRRLRRSVLSEKVVYRMEMVRPNVNGTALGNKDISPISPIKQWESPTDSESANIWPSPVSGNAKRTWVKPSNASHRTQTSHTGSVSTFDESVIESDRARAQSEMERLYAAVAVHDAEQKAKKDQTSLKSPRQEQFAAPLPSPRQEYWAPVMMSPMQAQFASPMASPQSARFPYGQQPPISPNQLSHPLAPTPAPNSMSPPLSPRDSSISSRLSKSGPLSFFSSRSRSSTEKDTFRVSVKGLSISNPLGSPSLKSSVGVVDEAPMSPRLYTPGPPPPTPGMPKTTSVSVLPTIQQSAEPSPDPQPRQNIGRAAPPKPLTLSPPNASAGQRSLGELPLRSYPAPPQSAPYHKIQYADRRESRINPGPKTGVPYPHSPYMPFSPVTPVSATIKTGKDLKLAKKMAAKAEKGLVLSEDEIWGN